MEEKKKMHPETARMYINAVRSILTKENYRKFLEVYGNDGETAKKWIALYHKLGRDKDKLNLAFKMYTEEKPKVLTLIDDLIELHKKKIEKLERIREGILIEGQRRGE